MPHISRNSVESGDKYDIKAMPTGICQKLVESGSFRFRS